MSGTTPHLLLAGNGPYTNRGCEAIVRGTLEILRKAHDGRARVTVATFGDPRLVARQAREERDPAISHLALGTFGGQWSGDWLQRQFLRVLHPLSDVTYHPRIHRFDALKKVLPLMAGMLEIGGDNYSMDYGWPEAFLGMDRIALQLNVPVALWGASVGPFDAAPRDAQEAMFRHLASMRAVFVRESRSMEYLRAHGVPNVRLMCDPAFVMPEEEPSEERVGFAMPRGATGINLSPLLARYVTGGDMGRWIQTGVNVVRGILSETGAPVVLIPHVSVGGGAVDDSFVLERIEEKLGFAKDKVLRVPGTLNAAETKWVIARCTAFIGARTHATIAALSSGVPTLSLAYSTKAEGLNRDIFGHQRYCLPAAGIGDGSAVVARFMEMIPEMAEIRATLHSKVVELRNLAWPAGAELAGMLSGEPVSAS